MNYLFKPLHTLPQFLTYFEERAHINQQFAPDFNGYFHNRYEVDGFDAKALHIGLFAQEAKAESLVGFLRICPQATANALFPEGIPAIAREFIERATSRFLPEPLPDFPMLAHYQLASAYRDSFPFRGIASPHEIMEVGRMVILKEDAPFTVALNLITVALSYCEALGAKRIVMSTQPRHQHFYMGFLGNITHWPIPFKGGKQLVASVLDLTQPLSNKQAVKEQIVTQLAREGVDLPLYFANHQYQPQTLLSPIT